METPTYVTLSAQVALERQLDVIADNVANANTTGFKADRQVFQAYVDKLKVPGGTVDFVQDRATYIDRTAGPVTPTGNPLDVAVQGDGFLAVQTSTGGTAYTRDGHLEMAQDGTLQDNSGRPVLGNDGQPIQIPPNYEQIEIKGDGTIVVRANHQTQEIGQIGMFRSSNPIGLRKAGDGTLNAPAGSMAPIEGSDPTSRMVQGSLEGSTVQPVKEIANMTELSRAYDRLQSLVSDDNDRERKMIEALGQQPA